MQRCSRRNLRPAAASRPVPAAGNAVRRLAEPRQRAFRAGGSPTNETSMWWRLQRPKAFQRRCRRRRVFHGAAAQVSRCCRQAARVRAAGRRQQRVVQQRYCERRDCTALAVAPKGRMQRSLQARAAPRALTSFAAACAAPRCSERGCSTQSWQQRHKQCCCGRRRFRRRGACCGGC